MTRNERGQIQETFDATNPVALMTKGYALNENTTGVPVGELKELLGEKVTLNLGSITDVTSGWGFSDSRTATLIPHIFGETWPRIADTINLTLTRTQGNTFPSDVWAFEGLADTWLRLTVASEGDVLSLQSLNAMSMVSTSDTGYAVGILVGRTTDNQVLVQPDPSPPAGYATPFAALGVNPPSDFDISAEFDFQAGGILGIRMARLTHFQPERRIAGKARAASEPTPPASLTFDGTVVAWPSPWVDISDDDPDGSDTLWAITTEARLDQVHGEWEVLTDEWVIGNITAERPDRYGFGEIGAVPDGPWSATRNDLSAWLRLRRAAGDYIYIPLGRSHLRNDDRNWKPPFWQKTWSGPEPYEVTPVLIPERRNEGRLLHASMELLSGEIYSWVIPADMIPTVEADTTGTALPNQNVHLVLSPERVERIDNDLNIRDNNIGVVLRFMAAQAGGATYTHVGTGTNYPGASFHGTVALRIF